MSLNKIALSACLITLASCNKHNDPPAYSANNTTSETTVDRTGDTTGLTPAAAPRSATESIARSRCQRELRCNNVGTDRKYASNQECLTKIRDEWRDDLSARECKTGVNQKELDECLAKIRDEDCNSPLDSLARVTECTQGQICND